MISDLREKVLLSGVGYDINNDNYKDISSKSLSSF